jgi:hypothetical protein
MAVIYVARSKGLCEWAGDVGLTKHVFKVGIADQTKAAVRALNEAHAAGQDDWQLVREADAGSATEAQALARLAAKEKTVDPTLYPRLKGEIGVFKVKPANVENHVIVKCALANEESLAVKLTNAEIAAYLIENALR